MTDRQKLTKKPENAPPACSGDESGNAPGFPERRSMPLVKDEVNAPTATAAGGADTPPPFTPFERRTLIIQVIGTVLQFIGTVLVVVSLVFIAYQTQQTAQQAELTAQQAKLTAQQAELQAYAAGSAQMSAIDNIFVEHPEVYPYFYEGKPIAQNDPEYNKVLTVAMAVTNFLETNLPRDGAAPMPWWEKYISDQFAISPIMCEYLERRNAWFDPRLVTIMREARDRTNSPRMSGAADPPIGEGK
jgi:hypothetical protein